LRPAQTNTLQDPISKITREKQTRGVAQVVEYLLGSAKSGVQTPVLPKNIPYQRDQEDHYTMVKESIFTGYNYMYMWIYISTKLGSLNM
jgi:hypothetical protein